MSCNEPFTLVTNGYSIVTNTKEVLLGIAIDKDLKFDGYVSSFFKKACQKLIAFVFLSPYINVEKRRV